MVLREGGVGEDGGGARLVGHDGHRLVRLQRLVQVQRGRGGAGVGGGFRRGVFLVWKYLMTISCESGRLLQCQEIMWLRYQLLLLSLQL